MLKSRNHKDKQRRKIGAAIIETVVGLFVLLPVFLILLDLIALVIGQTINDDLAKKAARYAAEASTHDAALANAHSIISNSNYTGSLGLVANAQVDDSRFVWLPPGPVQTVTVVTEVTINLPVPVPLGGPKSQVMQTQATEPVVGISAKPANAL